MNLNGKTALVTGATSSGIGAHAGLVPAQVCRLIDPAYRAVAQRCCEPPPHAASFPRCRSLRLSPTRSCAG
jgi:hypothetical protein